MTKKYNSPMLTIVSIKNNVICTSGDETMNMYGKFNGNSSGILAPNQRGLDFESWYEGY